MLIQVPPKEVYQELECFGSDLVKLEDLFVLMLLLGAGTAQGCQQEEKSSF